SDSGASPITTRSRDKSDTVDLLECGFAAAHCLEGGLAQHARARSARRFLELAHRGARRDQLAQLVVQHHQLGDRLASLVARAAALAAAAADAEADARGLLDRE